MTPAARRIRRKWYIRIKRRQQLFSRDGPQESQVIDRAAAEA